MMWKKPIHPFVRNLKNNEMKNNFNHQVDKMSNEEIESFQKYLRKKNELYYDIARNEGFDNMEDYESAQMSKIALRTALILLAIEAAAVLLYIYL